MSQSGHFIFGSYPEYSDLSAVSARLHALGIPHRFILSGHQQQLILLEQEHADAVREVMDEWEQGRLSHDTTKATATNRSTSAGQALALSSKKTPLTLVLIFLGFSGAALAGFGWQFIHPFTFWDFSQLPLYVTDNFNPWADILNGEVWRLITPIFLHFGLVHIIFNALWMWYLLSMVEINQGWLMALLLTAFMALASNSAQAIMSDGVIFGGLSGVVHGLFAYCWLWGRMHKASTVRLPDVLFIVITLLMLLSPLGIFDIIIGSDIADTAHISGYVSGLVSALALSLFYPNIENQS